MAGNQLPVLTLDFSDEKIQKLQEIAEKFKAALSIGPGGLPVPSTPSAPLPAPATPPGSSTENGKKQTGETEFDKFLKGLNKDAQGTLKTFGLINKTLGATTSTLKGLFETTVSWGARLTSMAVAGPFGYGYMANQVAKQYRGAQELGLTQGQADAAHSVYGTRFSGTDSIMQSLANARENPFDPMSVGLHTLGLNRLDSPAENMPKLLVRVAELLKQYKGTGVSQAILDSNGLGGIDVGFTNQILENSSQIPGWNDTFSQRSRQLDQTLTPAMLGQYQDTSSNLAHDADRIGNAFIAALTRLNRPINLLSVNLTSSIERFLDGPNGQFVFDSIRDGLNSFAEFIGGDKFQDSLNTFIKALTALGRATWAVVKFIGEHVKLPESVEDAEKNSFFKLKPGEKRAPPTMLGLAEAFGGTIGGLGKFTANELFIKPISGQMDMLKDAITPTSTKKDLQNYAKLQNRKHLLPGNLLNSVAETESSWNPLADSGKAKGLFQFTPETGKGYGLEGAALWDPYKQTNAAARYFGDLSKRYGGDIAKMVSQYNGGNKAVSEDGSLNIKQ